jgi:hypothetical protein
LSIAYDAGLRASEVASLKVPDIDSARMVLRVEQGKCRKDRHAMLSLLLLHILRECIDRPRAWLFPGQNPVNPITTRQRNCACHAAVHMAEIKKRVSMQTLRYGFARNNRKPRRIDTAELRRVFDGLLARQSGTPCLKPHHLLWERFKDDGRESRLDSTQTYIVRWSGHSRFEREAPGRRRWTTSIRGAIDVFGRTLGTAQGCN